MYESLGPSLSGCTELAPDMTSRPRNPDKADNIRLNGGEREIPQRE